MFTPPSWPAPDLLSRQAETTPDRTALVAAETDRAWTYRELATGPVAELAGAIRAAGLEPGDHLGALVPAGIDVARIVHAAARAGVVFVPVSPEAPETVVQRQCAAADVDGLVVSGTTRLGNDWFEGPVLPLDGHDDAGDSSPAHRWHRDDVQWVVFTSGTTGPSKPVQLTAGNLASSATASALRLGVESDDRWLACLPMHHVGGLAPLVRSALYGTTAVTQSGFHVDRTAGIIADYRITGVSLVPTMLTRLLDAGWTPPAPLRFVLLGGAPADRELIERCETAGVPVHPTYGATETASQIATARPETAFNRPGTVGRPLRGVDVEVRGESGESLPPGTAGELVVSGPMVSPGYYGDSGGTDERFEDGSFHTRDRGYRDASGRLWVVGRLDDVVLTGGETVHPAVVEAVLRRHPQVGDAVVVGLTDDEWGQVVAALVSWAGETSVGTAALRAYSRDHLDAPAVPKVIETVDELPRTASGTVDRAKARDHLREVRRRGGL